MHGPIPGSGWSEHIMPTLVFEGKSIPVLPQETVASALRRGGVPVALACGGKNRCGRCTIKLISGTFSSGGRVFEVSPAHPAEERACTLYLLSGSGSAAFPAEPQTAFDEELPVLPGLERIRPVFTGTAAVLDLGTTNVAAVLIENGRIVRFAEMLNAQTRCGDNVIDRIAFAARREGTAELRRALLEETVMPLLRRLTDSPEKIEAVAAAGNTVMTHFFFGADPSSMGCAPFTPEEMHFSATAQACGLAGLRPETPVSGAELVCGFIGGDISAGMTVSGFGAENARELYMDIGTNCEMVLNDRGRYTALSAAAGPAFERTNLRAGQAGCVRHIRYADRKWFLTPETDTPSGLCGTALADLLAESRRNDLIDDFGRWVRSPGLPETLLPDNARMAELITAKAAVESGLVLLARHAGLDWKEVEKVYLAGSFAEHLDIANGIAAGLLPCLPQDRFVKLGNASLAGAAAMLLDPMIRAKTETWRHVVRHLSPAEDPAYPRIFASAMRIGKGEKQP